VVAGIHALATFRQDLDNGNSCYIIFCYFAPRYVSIRCSSASAKSSSGMYGSAASRPRQTRSSEKSCFMDRLPRAERARQIENRGVAMVGMLGERLAPHRIDQKALRAVLLADIARQSLLNGRNIVRRNTHVDDHQGLHLAAERGLQTLRRLKKISGASR
jgi:hypothetical protein